MRPSSHHTRLKKFRDPSRRGSSQNKYEPRFCQALIDHCSNGYSFSSFAPTIGVDRHALARWVEAHPEFAQAKTQAEDSLELWHQREAMLYATGKRDPRTVVAFIWRSKNVAKWRDRNEVEATVTTIAKSPAEQAADLGAYDKLR